MCEHCGGSENGRWIEGKSRVTEPRKHPPRPVLCRRPCGIQSCPKLGWDASGGHPAQWQSQPHAIARRRRPVGLVRQDPRASDHGCRQVTRALCRAILTPTRPVPLLSAEWSPCANRGTVISTAARAARGWRRAQRPLTQDFTAGHPGGHQQTSIQQESGCCGGEIHLLNCHRGEIRLSKRQRRADRQLLKRNSTTSPSCIT